MIFIITFPQIYLINSIKAVVKGYLPKLISKLRKNYSAAKCRFIKQLTKIQQRTIFN